MLRPDCFECLHLGRCVGVRDSDMTVAFRKHLCENHPMSVGHISLEYEPRVDGPPFCFRGMPSVDGR